MTAAQAKARSYRARSKELLRDSSLSIEARVLLLLIETFADMDGRNAHPSMETLAELSGHQVAWVKKYLRELRTAGRLTSSTMPTAKGRVNVYTIHWVENRTDGVGSKKNPTGRVENRPKTGYQRTGTPYPRKSGSSLKGLSSPHGP